MPAPTPTSVYQIKVTLNDSKPPIWRRVLVEDTTTLSKLHTILQTVMGWMNSHRHQFIIDDEYYGAGRLAACSFIQVTRANNSNSRLP
ncbi:MAG: plasmid pRiA4b ORF-3 family protein [Chloroflexi bacterium]|nr:plasmid pRiA4b ORF-3 family protein [Chloroflexota bacterium]